MEALDDIVRHLVLNKGISHHQILQHIRSIITGLSKDLPKLKVLYNNQHGGFGFSDAFDKFVEENGAEAHEYDFDARIEYVQYIQPFGELVMSKYPMLRRMFAVYKYYNISTMVDCAIQTYYSDRDLVRYAKRLTKLQHLLSDPDMHGNKVADCDNGTPLYNMLNYNIDLSGHTAATYELCISEVQKCIEDCKIKRQKNKDDYVKENPSLKWNEIYQLLEPIVHQILEEKWGTTTKTCKMSFCDTLFDLGDSDANTWASLNNQNFCTSAMRFLRIVHQDNEKPILPEGDRTVYDFLVTHSLIEIPEDMYNKLAMDVGLLCASSKHCTLKIGEVPKYVDWSIDEYDGRESIVLD